MTTISSTSLLAYPESSTSIASASGKVDKLLESVIAFANSDGGMIAIGLEDPDKAIGATASYGLERSSTTGTSCSEAEVPHHRTRSAAGYLRTRVHTAGWFCWIDRNPPNTEASRVHAIVDNGTYVRPDRRAIKRSRHARSLTCALRAASISAESQTGRSRFSTCSIRNTGDYAGQRGLTRPSTKPCSRLGLPRRMPRRIGADEGRRPAVRRRAVRRDGRKDRNADLPLPTDRNVSTDPNTNLAKPRSRSMDR